MTTIELPPLTSYQRDIWNFFCKSNGDIDLGSGKVAVVKSTRQSGKSFLAQMLLIAVSFSKNGAISAIYEPSLGQSRVQYKAVVNAMKGSDLIKNANSSLLEIEFINGSTIYFKSTEQSSRGYTVDFLILDEAAWLREDEIYSILPLASAKNAIILVASTPFISDGYFYTLYNQGLNPTDKLKSFDWSKEPEIDRFLTPERKEFYRQTMSRSKYITEVLGEFLSDQGMLFRNIEACCTTDERPEVSGKLFIGVDWGSGTENDYTAIAVINDNGEQCGLYTINNQSPMQQIEWASAIIKDLATKATIAKLTCEANSIGAVYIDALKQKIGGKIKITEFVTSNKSKQDLVTTLQLALENKDITLMRDDEQLNQLRSYEAQINPRTKSISYNGKAGVHDDICIALMLAYFSYKQRLGTYSITFK